MYTKKIASLMLILSLLFTGCKKEAKEEVKAEELKKVVATKVVRRELTDKYEADSIAIPKEKVNYIAESSGIVVKLNKKNGDRVKTGDIIIERTDATVEAEYNSARATYQAAKETLQTASKNHDKYKRLYDKGNASEKEYTDVRDRFTDAEGNFLTKKAKFEDVQDRYNKLKRMAKNDGIVGNLFAKVGNKTEKGDILFTVIDETEMEALVDFPGKWFSKLLLGGEATVIIPELENRELKGYIKEINPIADSETKKYKVKIGIPNIDPTSQGAMVKDGMYLKAIIPAGKRNALMVPQKSVQVRSLLSYIYLVKDGVAKRIEIIPGTVNAPFVEISSEVLNEGESVVVDGIFGLNDGDKIQEIENK
ncbi:MAG: efflux RND transporter periplasmic adaptor subunit [Fusobacteriaceae bacterium]